MGKFFIKDAHDDRKEITFQTLECEEPNYWVDVIIRDEGDIEYGHVKVSLKKLMEAIDWCTPTEFKEGEKDGKV